MKVVTHNQLFRALRSRRREVREAPIAPPPDLTLLFKAQARLANIPESAIHATAGYYRAIAPTLNIEQLHQLALLFNDEFEAGLRVGEGARRQQEGE